MKKVIVLILAFMLVIVAVPIIGILTSKNADIAADPPNKTEHPQQTEEDLPEPGKTTENGFLYLPDAQADTFADIKHLLTTQSAFIEKVDGYDRLLIALDRGRQIHIDYDTQEDIYIAHVDHTDGTVSATSYQSDGTIINKVTFDSSGQEIFTFSIYESNVTVEVFCKTPKKDLSYDYAINLLETYGYGVDLDAYEKVSLAIIPGTRSEIEFPLYTCIYETGSDRTYVNYQYSDKFYEEYIYISDTVNSIFQFNEDGSIYTLSNCEDYIEEITTKGNRGTQRYTYAFNDNVTTTEFKILQNGDGYALTRTSNNSFTEYHYSSEDAIYYNKATFINYVNGNTAVWTVDPGPIKFLSDAATSLEWTRNGVTKFYSKENIPWQAYPDMPGEDNYVGNFWGRVNY